MSRPLALRCALLTLAIVCGAAGAFGFGGSAASDAGRPAQRARTRHGRARRHLARTSARQRVARLDGRWS